MFLLLLWRVSEQHLLLSGAVLLLVVVQEQRGAHQEARAVHARCANGCTVCSHCQELSILQTATVWHGLW